MEDFCIFRGMYRVEVTATPFGSKRVRERPWMGSNHQPFGSQPHALTDCATETPDGSAPFPLPHLISLESKQALPSRRSHSPFSEQSYPLQSLRKPEKPVGSLGSGDSESRSASPPRLAPHSPQMQSPGDAPGLIRAGPREAEPRVGSGLPPRLLCLHSTVCAPGVAPFLPEFRRPREPERGLENGWSKQKYKEAGMKPGRQGQSKDNFCKPVQRQGLDAGEMKNATDLRGRNGGKMWERIRSACNYPTAKQHSNWNGFVKVKKAIPHFAFHTVARRDRIVVSTLRCGRSNLGSNPSHGSFYVLHCIYRNNSWSGRRPPKRGGSGERRSLGYRALDVLQISPFKRKYL